MDRYWLLTSTFYGNWLPGDPRGFVSRVRDARPEDPPTESRRQHDVPGTPYDADLASLHRRSKEQLRAPPVRIDREQAQALLAQFHETAAYRGWKILAAAIMPNHVHLVVGVFGDPSPTKILGDFKSYGSRTLNRRCGKPPSETWWTYDGSKRKLASEAAVRAAVEYVRNQPGALSVFVAAEYMAPQAAPL